MRRISSVLFVFLLLITSVTSLGQGNISLPTVLPASPEPAAMAKAGNMDVSLSNGMANASIPLYELKAGNNTIPISLNYSSNGYKVDEVSSRVGTGWTLQLGGVVTRMVRGKPDEKFIRANDPPSGNMTLQQMVQYYDDLSATGPNDNEPDEYYISAPGLSGRFTLDKQGQPLQLPYGNNKIECNITSNVMTVKVTAVNGAVYYFGYDGLTETTGSYTANQGHSNTKTAMFLNKIEYPDGTKFTFNYTALSYWVFSAVSQSITSGVLSNAVDPLARCNCSGSMPPDQAGPIGPGALSQQLHNIQYHSYYLHSVVSSDGPTVNLIYLDRPDQQGDKRLTGVNVAAGTFSREYTLSYLDPVQSYYPSSFSPGSGSNFFLHEISWQVPNGTNQTSTLKYRLDYDQLEKLPARLSFAQDFMGYYNGRSNAYLLPATPNTNEVNWGSQYAVADRSPDYRSSRVGMLTRLTHPTGGFEEFDYEANQYATSQLANTTDVKFVVGSGTSQNGAYQTATYYSPSFSILQDQTANLTFWAFQNPGCSSCTPPPANTVNIAYVYLQDLTASTQVQIGLLREYVTMTASPQLLAGHTYQLKLEVRGLPNSARAEIRYDYASGPQYVFENHEAPGVRIKSIRSFDPVSMQQTSRYFFYRNQITSNVSSAEVLFQPRFITESYNEVLCQTDLDPSDLAACRSQNGVEAFETARAKFKTLSSNPMYLNYGYDGTQILYKSVFEADDPSLANGYIQHKFHAYEASDIELVFGSMLDGVPNNAVTNTTALEYETGYYNSVSQVVKKQQNYYSVDWNDYSKEVIALKVNKRHTHIKYDWGRTEIMMSPYDVIQYKYKSRWIQLDSSVITDYANGGVLVNKSSQFYGSPANVMPIRTETTDSKGAQLVTETTYPTDYPNVLVYQKMVSRNLITQPVSVIQKKGTSILSSLLTDYKIWNETSGSFTMPSSLIATPEVVKASRLSDPLASKMRYFGVDGRGNPLEVAKENGKHVAYIWDYNGRFPVAEVQNAGQYDIPYTGFETESTGNWTVVNGNWSRGSSVAMTGGYWGSAHLVKAVDPAKTYIVTIWVNSDGDSRCSVNGVNGTVIWQKGFWSLFKWEISNASQVEVDGVGMDDVRLYPKGAQMVTYTYYPYVGIGSVSDINCRINYYEYDDAHRLLRIRDIDKNIVKQFDYQYHQQIMPCTSTTADWQPTGLIRCVQAGPNNNLTGDRESEQIDMNNCSATYLQKQWVITGPGRGCTAVSNCTGADKRVIIVSGVASCYNGTKVLVSSLQISANQWQCTYHYVWQDGFVGPDFIETSATSCQVGLPPVLIE